MTKLEMARVIFDGDEYRAEKYARHTDKEQVTRAYNRAIEKRNRRIVLPNDKFSALQTALYKRNGGYIYCQHIYNTSPVEFQVCWGGKWASVEEARKHAREILDEARLAEMLNTLHIVVGEDNYSGEDYFKLIERYSEIVGGGFEAWLDLVDEGKVAL